MLDIHTHILPKVDDGSHSLKQSIIMLQREARHGVNKVVLTPHFYANRESPERFLQRRDAAFQKASEAAEGRKVPEMILGAEVAYFSGISRVEGIEKLCIGETCAMLIEMPFHKWTDNVIEEIIFLRQCRGIIPIIAHVERYLKYQSFGTIGRLCDAGILIQANASFFFRWQTAWLAMRMLKRKEIHFIGSDCHNLKSRKPNMDQAIEAINKKLGKNAIAYLNHMERTLFAEDCSQS